MSSINNCMHTVYKITNIKNSKIYIGYTGQTIEQRWRRHCRDAFSGKYDYKFVRAIKKYGPESFIIETLEIVESKDAGLSRERELIKEYNSRELGYNTHEGGKGGHTGAYHKVGRSGAANHMHGKHHTEESKQKQRESHKLWRETDDGQKHLERSRQQFLTNNPGKVKSEQMLERLSKSQKERLAEMKELAKNGKIFNKSFRWFLLTHPDLSTTFECGLINVVEKYSLNKSCLSDTLRGRQSHHRGYKIRYATEEEIKSLQAGPANI